MKHSKPATHCIAVFLMIVTLQASAVAQPEDTTVQHSRVTAYQPKPVKVRSFILPASLITVGAVGAATNSNIPDEAIYEARNRNLASFHTSVDNYLQFAPIAAGYGMLINDKQHRFWKYTEKVVVTEIIVTGLAQSVKRIVKRPRPDDAAPESFPSGHTSQAFASATVFSDEFAQHNTWLAIGAYASASAVGVLRVLNNRHWASDVIAGAGFGILSAKLSELIIEPTRKKQGATYSLHL